MTDLKKRDLDDFVKTFRSRNWVRKTDELYKRTSLVLDLMADVFVASDPLLKPIGMIVLYYQLLRDAWQNDWLTEVQRARLVEFEDQRELNRTRVREAQELALTGKRLPPDVAINPALVAFERFVQSPNDVTALTKRYETLKRFVRAARLS